MKHAIKYQSALFALAYKMSGSMSLRARYEIIVAIATVECVGDAYAIIERIRRGEFDA